MKEFLYTAKILSPHGVKGYLKVKPFSDSLDHLHDMKELSVETKTGSVRVYGVQDLRPFAGLYLIKFREVNNPEDAVLLSGSLILIPREHAKELEGDEVYVADLIGMKLIYNGENVGEVVSTAEGSQSLLLEVRCMDGKFRYVPFIRNVFVSDVDVASNSMKLLRRELVE